MRSFRDLNQVVVGVIAVLVLTGAIAGAFALGTFGWFDDRYALSAVVTGTGGMERGAVVRVAGVDVGEVTGVHADFERGQVIVDFEVDSGVALSPDTRAEIVATTLLGGYHLRLSMPPGPVGTPHLEDLDADDPRRRIPLERTRAPTSLVGTLGEATDTVAAIDIEAVNDVLARVAGATDRNVEVLPELIDGLGSIAAATAAREAEIRELVTGSEELVAAVAARDAELLALVDAATVLLESLAERRDQLATILGSGNGAVTQLTETLASHRAAIDGVLAHSRTVLDAVDDNVDLINTSLAQVGPTFALLANVRSDNGAGFDVAVEGFVAHPDQLRGLLGVLFPEVAP